MVRAVRLARTRRAHNHMKRLLPRQYAKILFELTRGVSGKALDECVAVFAKFLVQQRALSLAPAIADAFTVYVRGQEGTRQIAVTAARELSGGEATRIGSVFGTGADVQVSVDAAQIGGVTVRDDNTIYDGSIRSHLARLYTALTA